MSIIERLRGIVRRSPATGPAGGEPSMGSDESVEVEYQRQMLALEGIRRTSADVTASRRRLESKAEEIRRTIEKLEGQAAAAAAQNQDDLARAALQQALQSERQLAQRQKVVDGLRSKEKEMAESSAKLQAHLQDCRARMEAVQARSSAAEAASCADSAGSKPGSPTGGA